MSNKRNENNERLKRRYLEWRKHARRLSEQSLDKEIAAIERFDAWNRRKNFRKFHIEQAMGFREHLERELNPSTGKLYSRSTILGTLNALREFVLWLSGQEGYRKRIRPANAEYFAPSRRDAAIARAAEPKSAPTPEQARHALSKMPNGTELEKRDRAAFALLTLTAARDGALITLRLKHVEPEEKCLWQNPKEVNTKFGKSIRTFFQQGYPEAERVIADWVRYQRETLLRGDEDPLFPKTAMGTGDDGGFRPIGLSHDFWSTAAPVRKLVREAFERAGVRAFGPHTFRHMHARAVLKSGANIEQLWAVSQNIGHSSMLTTLGSYGQLPEDRRRALILGES